MKSKIFALLVCLSLTLSCSQKRAERFSQGQGRDLYAVMDFQNKEFSLQTKNRIGSSPTNNAIQTSIQAPHYQFYAFPLVQYETDAKLLGEVAIPSRVLGITNGPIHLALT